MNYEKMNITPDSRKGREYIAYYKSKKICLCCRRDEVYQDYTKCLTCLIDSRERAKKYNAITETSYKRRQHNKRMTALCIAFKVCQYCKKRDVSDNHTCCDVCLAKKRNTYLKNKEDIPRSMRVEMGLCYFCGKPVSDGKKICNKCFNNNPRYHSNDKK